LSCTLYSTWSMYNMWIGANQCCICTQHTLIIYDWMVKNALCNLPVLICWFLWVDLTAVQLRSVQFKVACTCHKYTRKPEFMMGLACMLSSYRLPLEKTTWERNNAVNFHLSLTIAYKSSFPLSYRLTLHHQVWSQWVCGDISCFSLFPWNWEN